MELIHHDTIRTLHADRLRAAEQARLVATAVAAADRTNTPDEPTTRVWPVGSIGLAGRWHRLVRRPAPAC
ncbi:MAG: hypothetical protein AAFO29_09760 [Actinomycetota bacterium]